ncbi:MAG: hypothetical protein ACI4SB_08470, partial [Acutalibacteraceae bacterium]
MNYKKLTQIAIIIVAAVWIFSISLIIGITQVRKQDKTTTTTLPPLTTVNATISPATTMPVATTQAQTQQLYSMDGNNGTTAPTVDDPDWLIAEKESIKASQEASEKAEMEKNVPKTKSEIVSAYIDAVNKLKKTKDFTLVKTNSLNMTIDELTGGDSIKSMADKLIKQNSPNGSVTYTFKDGIAQETGEEQAGKSPDQVIAPIGRTAAVTEDFVKDAFAQSDSNGGYTLRLSFNSETQTLDSEASGYANCMEVIDVEALGLPSGTNLESLSIVYDNSYIEASINKDGKITSMKHYMEVTSASGNGKYLIIPVQMKSHGDFTSEYQITYCLKSSFS